MSSARKSKLSWISVILVSLLVSLPYLRKPTRAAENFQRRASRRDPWTSPLYPGAPYCALNLAVHISQGVQCTVYIYHRVYPCTHGSDHCILCCTKAMSQYKVHSFMELKITASTPQPLIGTWRVKPCVCVCIHFIFCAQNMIYTYMHGKSNEIYASVIVSLCFLSQNYFVFEL